MIGGNLMFRGLAALAISWLVVDAIDKIAPHEFPAGAAQAGWAE